jgi:hypothetical protein
MSFPPEMSAGDQRRLAFLSFLIVVVVAAIAAFIAVLALDGGGTRAGAQTVREYNLEIVPADIDYGGGNIWHAWTYKLADAPAGTVPGRRSPVRSVRSSLSM